MTNQSTSDDEQTPTLLTYLTTASSTKRDAAFLRTYAARVRDGTAATWEIPNTIAATLESIARRLEEFRDLRDHKSP